MTESPQPPLVDRAHRRPRRRLIAVLALGAAFVAGGVTTGGLAAAAQGMAEHHMMAGPGGMHAMAMAHLTKLLDQAGASEDQKTRIGAILRTGFAPLADMHQGMSDIHARLHALLTAPTIDRVALESLRAEAMGKLDDASRTMTKAMADAAEVLTPEQRARFGAAMSAAHGPS